MPFIGDLLWRLKREISGFLNSSGSLSTTAFWYRTFSGKLDTLTGSLSTKVFYKRSLAGNLTFAGTNDPVYVQIANVSGTIQNFAGTISAVYSEGEELNLKGLYKMGNSLRMR